MGKYNLIPRAQSLTAQFSEVSPEMVEKIELLARDTFAEYGAPYQVRPIADVLPKPLKFQFLSALNTLIESPGNKDSFKARGLRAYVDVGLSAFLR